MEKVKRMGMLERREGDGKCSPQTSTHCFLSKRGRKKTQYFASCLSLSSLFQFSSTCGASMYKFVFCFDVCICTFIMNHNMCAE